MMHLSGDTHKHTMCKLPRYLTIIAIFVTLIGFSACGSRQPVVKEYETREPAVLALKFRADWCEICHVVEHKLEHIYPKLKDKIERQSDGSMPIPLFVATLESEILHTAQTLDQVKSIVL